VPGARAAQALCCRVVLGHCLAPQELRFPPENSSNRQASDTDQKTTELQRTLPNSSEILKHFPTHGFRAENSMRFFGIALAPMFAVQMAR